MSEKIFQVFLGLKLFQYHKWRSYVLIVFTVIVCCIGYYTKIPAFALLFSYIVGFAILKSFVSIKLKDLFNMKSVKSIFKTIGGFDLFISFISLLIIFGYYFIMENIKININEVIPIFLTFIIIYRFLFLDMEYLMKNFKKIKK